MTPDALRMQHDHRPRELLLIGGTQTRLEFPHLNRQCEAGAATSALPLRIAFAIRERVTPTFAATTISSAPMQHQTDPKAAAPRASKYSARRGLGNRREAIDIPCTPQDFALSLSLSLRACPHYTRRAYTAEQERHAGETICSSTHTHARCVINAQAGRQQASSVLTSRRPDHRLIWKPFTMATTFN